MYAAREFKKETPHKSNHPGDYECQQYLHLVEKDLGTKHGPGDGLLLDVCPNELISFSYEINKFNAVAQNIREQQTLTILDSECEQEKLDYRMG